MSFIVMSEILGLFVNTLTPDYKHSLRNSDNFLQPIQMQLSQKQKPFSDFFPQFLKSKSNVEDFSKKRWPTWLMYFRSYVLRRMRLDKYLRSSVSKHLSIANMLKDPERCGNMLGSSFYHSFSPLWGN